MARWLTVTAVWVAMLILVLGQPHLASAATPEVQAFLGGVSSGPTTGGTGVRILGDKFADGAIVTFGGIPATDVMWLGARQLFVVSPPGSAGSVAVVVANPSGETNIGSLVWTYIQAGGVATATPAPGATSTPAATATPAVPTTQPIIGSIVPPSGPASGGTPVTINGNGFSTGSTVKFGANPATSVSVVSSTQITVVTPAGTQGPVAVLVTAPGSAVGGLDGGFTYSLSSPVVAGVTPISGPVAGGTVVTITGSGFLSGATVKFGGAFAPSVTVAGPTQILATTPPGVVGSVAVLIENPGGVAGGVPTGYTYTAPSLGLTAVSPNSGPVAGGTAVTISGAAFQFGATVTFGAAAATNVTVVGPTQITAVSPAGPPGSVAVTVTNPGGSNASMGGAFTYQGAGAGPISLPTKGLGLFVFGGGSNDDLVRASGCPVGTAAFWASDGVGGFIVYVPGTSIAAVNAAWNARFPAGLPASTPLGGRCQ